MLRNRNLRLQLIREVQSRPALWERKHLNRRNTIALDEGWAEVSSKLNISVRSAKIKWRGLKQDFKKHYEKALSEVQQNSGTLQSSWLFFNNLMFLRNEFRRLKCPNLPNDDKIIFNYNDIPFEDGNVNALAEVTTGAPSCNAQATPSTLSTTSSVLSCASEYDQRKMKTPTWERFAPNSEMHRHLDEDVDFFNSLLPHVRTLPPAKKLLFRIDVQKLLYERAYSGEETGRRPAQVADDILRMLDPACSITIQK